MSNDISSIQSQIQNVALVHYGGGHGHNQKIIKMPIVVLEDEKETGVCFKPRFKLTMTVQINVDPDDDSNQRKQKKKILHRDPKKDEEMEEKPFGLDSLEIIGQINRIVLYTLANIKNSDYH